MEIDVKDYLSEDETKGICREAVINRVSELLRTEQDVHRFLTNNCYEFVWKAVDNKCPGDMLGTITKKIPDIVEKLSGWDVFRAPDAWHREARKGWELLQKAVSEAEPLIKERVAELIKEIDMQTIKYLINEHIDNIIENLQEKQNGQ